MRTFVTGLLLVVVLVTPSAITLLLIRAVHRRGLDVARHPPDTIDYDKW
jgi:hypothetical protein